MKKTTSYRTIDIGITERGDESRRGRWFGKLSPRRLSRASSHHPWRVIGIWIVAVVAAIALSATMLADAVTPFAGFTNDPESKRAEALIEERFGSEPSTEVVIVRSRNATVDDPVFRRQVQSLQRDIMALGPETVDQAVSYVQTKDESLVSQDRHSTLIPVVLAGDDDAVVRELPKLQSVVAQRDRGAFEVLLFGEHSIGSDFDALVKKDLATGEMFGILVALVILLAVFGAVVAGIIPVLVALASIAAAMGLVAVVGQAFTFSMFVENMIAMMGLALGIDYSLFIISRYREERSRDRDKFAAIEMAGATASRAVLFSGTTVLLALLGMIIVPHTIFRSLAGGAIFVAISSVLASLTLLPALLGLLGDKVNALRVFRRKAEHSADSRGVWDRMARGVMRRPVTSVTLSAGLLIVAAIPYFGINIGFPGVSTLPEDTQSRRAFEIMAQDFSGGIASPVKIAVDGDASSPAIRAGIDALSAALETDGIFGPTALQSNDSDLIVVSVPVAGDPSSDTAVAAVERLRNEYIPDAFANTDAEVLVGGDSAGSQDELDLINRYTPAVFGFVLGMSFLLLMLVFRSIVVPLKAIVMNLLSVGAAYGLIVLVSQEGVGAGLLGFQQVEAVAAWIPLFLFSILFGLSMDYHVFLLSRIREHFDETGDNAESVAYGLRTTGRIITGAALIMVAVFGGFAAGDLVMLQQMGLGLGVAVLLDATIVRSVLVPASMKLLGDRNWYLPRWLSWLPQLQVEATHEIKVTGGAVTPAIPKGVQATSVVAPSSIK